MMTKNNLSSMGKPKSKISKPQSLKATMVADSKGEFKKVKSRRKRKQAEENPQGSGDRYNALYYHSLDCVYVFDCEGLIIDANPRAAELLGYDMMDILSLNIASLLDERDLARARQDFKDILQTGFQKRLSEYRFRRKDGSFIDMEIHASVIRHGGKPHFIQVISHDITSRTQAEAELRRSEEKYKNILESIEEGYYEVDLNAKFTFLNDSMARIFEHPKERLMGKNLQRYADEETAQKNYALFKDVYATGEPVKLYERNFIGKDGAKRYVESSISLQKDSSGTPIGFRGIVRDITERKQIEKAWRENEEKYRSVIEHMQEGYFENDLAGNFIFVNDAMCRLTGYCSEELIGKNNRQITTEESAKRTYEAYNKIYRTGEPVKGIEEIYIRKDGTKGFAEVSASLMRDAEGNPIGFQSVSRDITERKQAEDTLRLSEEKYRMVIENAKEAIIITQDVKLVFANRAAVDLVGYSEEIVTSNPFTDYIHPDDRDLVIAHHIGRIKGEEVPDVYSFRIICHDGSLKWVELNAALVQWKGRPATLNFLNDISERKRAEEERKQSFVRLRKVLGATVQSISKTVEMRDPYTSGHQRRVSDLGRAIATEMGLSADRQDFIRTAANIHDIGKIAIPSEILSKPTKLTDLEFKFIKTHSQSGYDILKDIEFPWPVADVVLQHHERTDGSGYPQGLKGSDILLEAQILAIADVVEAISSHRPYRPGLGIDTALKEISEKKGILYNADAVDACLRLFLEKGYTLVLRN